MDYTGGMDLDQREDSNASKEPTAQAAHNLSKEVPSPSAEPTLLPIPPQRSSLVGGPAPPPLAAAPTLPSPPPYTGSGRPPQSARAHPIATGPPPTPPALPSASAWAPHNSPVGGAPSASNRGPPPPTGFPPPFYAGAPPNSHPDAPPPSYYRPPLTQPPVPLTPDRSAPWEYAWNPSHGFFNAPTPPIPPPSLVNAQTSTRGRGWPGRRVKDATRGRGAERGGRAEIQANGEVEEDEQEDVEETRTGRNRAMFPNEKLTLIRECAEHANEYALNNRQKYWAKVATLLKEKTGYSLKSPRLTVERWVKSRLDEFTQERMGFPSQVEADDFRAKVEKFGERWRAVAEEKEQLQKSQTAIFVTEKLAKLRKDREEEFDPLLLHRRLVNTIEDEPMAGVDSATEMPTGRSTPSLSLNGSSKRRRLDEDSYQFRETAELMVSGMKDSMGVLAEGLRQSVVAVKCDSDLVGRIQALERSTCDTNNALERNNQVISDLDARLIRVEEGVKTLLELLTKKKDDIDDHNGALCNGHLQ